MICEVCNKVTPKNKYDEADRMCIDCQNKYENCEKCGYLFLDDGTGLCEDCKEDED